MNGAVLIRIGRVSRYFFILLISLAVLITGQGEAQASTVEVRVDKKYNAEVGTFVEVPVFIQNSPGMAAFQFTLFYDPEVAVVMPRAGETRAVKWGSSLPASSGSAENLNFAGSGELRANWYAQEVFYGSGEVEVCRITFKVLSEGDTDLDLEVVDLVDEDGQVAIGNISAVSGLLSVGPPPSITGVSITGGNQSISKDRMVQLSVNIEPGNAPYKGITWSSSNTQVAIVSNNGLVTARNVGTTQITVVVSTDERDYESSITLTVTEQPAFTIDTPREIPHGYTGRYYEFVYSTSDGLGPYTWIITSGNLPPGLYLNSSTGRIYGTPSQPGRYDFTLRVTDNAGRRVYKDFVFWIAERDSSDYFSGFLYPSDWGAFKNLNLNHGSLAVNLQPHELPYTMVVDRNTTNVNIRVNLIRSSDRLRINGTLQSQASARTITLRPRTNIITITIQPSSGDPIHYDITIFKLP